MHVAVAHAARGKAVEIGRGDGAAVAAQLPEAGVVEDDEEDVGRAIASPQRRRPSLFRLVERAADDAGECGPRPILLEPHGFLLRWLTSTTRVRWA